ncbi:MAG: hypothetical protein K2J30_02585 [Clostridia bacterium]|nr:hypothetical protein [Clostridia bacterium]
MANNNRRRNNGSVTRYDVIKICCYIALVIGALFVFINNLLPVCGVTVSGPLFAILSLIERLAFLIGVGLAAYGFAASKGKKSAWFIIFIIAIVLFIVGIVLGFI